ncbi:MAG: hypothetical protein Q9178_006777 [Gyalolechia marmorata]
MVGLPADAIVEIIFGILNATLTVTMIWQNRNIHRERYRMLGDLLYHGLLLNQYADPETGDEISLGHAPIKDLALLFR